MFIWLALLVPVTAGAIIYSKHRKQAVFWEYFSLFAVTLIGIILLKFSVETAQVQDKEFWGSWSTRVVHFEKWDEKISCQHPEYCSMPSTCTDFNGDTYVCIEDVYCGDKHEFDVRVHEPYSVLHGSGGEEFQLSKADYDQIAGSWGGGAFVEMNRDSYSIDGDKYVASWDHNPETLIPITTEHTYENRVQGVNDFIQWEEVSDLDKIAKGLYDYPPIKGFTQRAIVGDGGSETVYANAKLVDANAMLGKSKQLRMYIFIYHNAPRDTAHWQRQYLKGGNKNEFILTVSIDDQGRPQWAEVISWTEEEDLMEDVAAYAMEYETLRLLDLTDYMIQECEQRWVRKEFADFSRVHVSPPLWGVLLTWILTILANALLSVCIVRNDIREVNYDDY